MTFMGIVWMAVVGLVIGALASVIGSVLVLWIWLNFMK